MAEALALFCQGIGLLPSLTRKVSSRLLIFVMVIVIMVMIMVLVMMLVIVTINMMMIIYIKAVKYSLTCPISGREAFPWKRVTGQTSEDCLLLQPENLNLATA